MLTLCRRHVKGYSGPSSRFYKAAPALCLVENCKKNAPSPQSAPPSWEASIGAVAIEERGVWFVLMGASCSWERLDYFESEADIAKLVRGMHRWMQLNVRT